MIPKEIKLTPEKELRIIWEDGHIASLPLHFLREECPCPECKGEIGLLGVFNMSAKLQTNSPGKYELKSATPVGNYAITLKWADGHDTGIYSWQYLLFLENKTEESG